MCLLIISMLCAENICVFGKWRARTVGRTRYVERVRGRSGRIGGCVGNGQATCGHDGRQACGHDGRQACGRSGDSDGFGGYGRLGCGWRVCGRGRPPRALVRQGAGGLRENCRPLVSYAFGRPKFFCKRRALPCKNSCGLCVSKKKHTPPRMDALPPRAARKTLAAAPQKKYTPAPQGVSQEHGAGNAARKKQPAHEKTLPFMKKMPAI